MIKKQTIFLLFTIFPMPILTLTACYQNANTQCHYATDCEPTSYCRAGQCVPASKPNKVSKKGLPHESDYDDAFDETNDSDAASSPDEPCSTGQTPQPGELVINEFLANVPSGLAGDANGDGIRHAHDDEFVELVNISEHKLILNGIKVQNDKVTKYTFSRYCLESGHAVVVFGGIEYGVAPPTGDGFQSVIAHSRFMFNNDQGTIVVRGSTNQELIRVNYERSPPQALTLSPELYGTRFVPHDSLASGTPFSPGMCVDHQSVVSGCSLDVADTNETDTNETDTDD